MMLVIFVGYVLGLHHTLYHNELRTIVSPNRNVFSDLFDDKII